MVINHPDGFPYLNLSFFWNLNFFFGKIDCSMNSGRQRAVESSEYKKKYIFSFSKLYKKWYQNCDNLQSGDLSLHLCFINYSYFVTILSRVLKMKIFKKKKTFLAIPHPLPSRKNQLYQKKFQKWYLEEGPGKTCPFFFFWKYPETKFFLVKLICQWIPNSEGRRKARDILKKYFHFQNSSKNGNKVGTI